MTSEIKISGSDSSLFLNISDSMKLNALIDSSPVANSLRNDDVMALDFQGNLSYTDVDQETRSGLSLLDSI